MDLSNAELYGKGIFTTVAVRNGTPLFWDKHWARLTCDSAIVGVDMSAHPGELVLHELLDAIKAGGLKNSRARITFHDLCPGGIWPGTTSVEYENFDHHRRNAWSDRKIQRLPYRPIASTHFHRLSALSRAII